MATYRIFIPIKSTAIRESIVPIVIEREGKPQHSPYLETLIKRNTKSLLSDLELVSDVVLFKRDDKNFLGFAIKTRSKFLESSIQGLLNTIFHDLKEKGILAKIPEIGYGLILEDLKKKQPFVWYEPIVELDPMYGGKR
jgi:hypothetical protein